MSMHFERASIKYFETIRCEDFEVFYLEYHQDRISRTIGININLSEYIYPPSNGLYRCKVIYDENGICDIEYALYKKKEINSFKLIHDDDIEYKYKYLDRAVLDNISALKDDCDEVIIVKNGFITDTSIANIAIYHDKRWVTPKIPLLQGTTRARLLEEKKIFEANITTAMLKDAKKLALMNAMIEFEILEDYRCLE